MGRIRFPFHRQKDRMDCGATCLRMIAEYHGAKVPIERLRLLSQTNRQGASLEQISDAAEKVGMRTLGVKISYEMLQKEAPFPCIIHWKQNHFVIVYKIKNNKVYVADPAIDKVQYDKKEFIRQWIGDNADEKTQDGIVLLIEPTPKLKELDWSEDALKQKKGLAFLYQYLWKYKKFLVQLSVGLLAGSLLQLLFPFFTQSIVDVGIQNQNIEFIYLILIAQILLFFGKSGIDLIRSWILLHLSTRINISLISDFFIKLMNLPISFFDVKMTGDIMQRIGDHKRIEKLLTSNSLTVLFSIFNLLVFGTVLAWYDLQIFTIFFIGTAIYFSWILLFLKRRKHLDYMQFAEVSKEQSKVMELINGMQEIKLHNAEKRMRWSWEYIQANLFKISMKSLFLKQSQTVGSSLIHEVKNILITVYSAKLVISGEITLGMMMSISYITGQLNSPIEQIIGFIFSVQDTKIALERLSEIHSKPDEDSDETLLQSIPKNQDLKLKQLGFSYSGTVTPVLKDLSLTIPSNKVTAIVGTSGSGKTTLMKLLLKFYPPNEGSLTLGKTELNSISHKCWREKCGVVMQDGYIFNDTIAQNIAIGEDDINQDRLKMAVEIANIKEFIEELPLGYNTKIGMEGLGISAGQRQRIMIARAVYKDPDFLFFDEATSALDANTEKTIVENLNEFFHNRTVVVIAHRLSTVKNADQIVVLEKGDIIEVGNHKELIEAKGSYYELISNQLELN